MKVTGQQYLNLNPDLKAAGVDPLKHFLDHVCPEGPLREPRIIDVPEPSYLPVDWNWEVYLAGWGDLRKASLDTKEEAEAHYLSNGFYEKRWPIPPLPIHWDDASYLFLYPDVAAVPFYVKFPWAHYYDSKATENRVYMPDGWIPSVYLELNPDVAADAYFGKHPLHHYWLSVKEGNPRPYKKEPPKPQGDIKSFQPITALDDPDNCYFTACRVNGAMQFGTYKDGSYQSKIKDINGNILSSFNAESCYQIVPFKGSYCMSQEHGKYAEVDRGMIYRLIDGNWQEVYHHPRWHIITEMYVNPVDGYIYASGCRWDDPKEPAGVVRSVDGINWEVWFTNPYEYRFWGMTSRPNGSVVIAATSGGVDWGGACSPSVFEGGNNLVWRDDSHRGSGFWACEYWHNDVYLGRCGDGAVVRLSDHKEVLPMPGFDSIHDLIVDKLTDTLIVFCSFPGDSGMSIRGTKDGDNWYTIENSLDVPRAFNAYYDDIEQTIYLPGGVFGGRGRVYKGVR
jgi:hypothetical protein